MNNNETQYKCIINFSMSLQDAIITYFFAQKRKCGDKEIFFTLKNAKDFALDIAKTYPSVGRQNGQMRCEEYITKLENDDIAGIEMLKNEIILTDNIAFVERTENGKNAIYKIKVSLNDIQYHLANEGFEGYHNSLAERIRDYIELGVTTDPAFLAAGDAIFFPDDAKVVEYDI